MVNAADRLVQNHSGEPPRPASRAVLDVRRPFPVYRKLLLENKLLLCAALLVFGTVAVTLLVHRVVIRDVLARDLERRFTGASSALLEQIGRTLIERDRQRLSGLLEHALRQDPAVLYVVALDRRGTVLARATAAPTSAGSTRDAKDPTPPAHGLVRDVPLWAAGQRTGSLRLGLNRTQIDDDVTGSMKRVALFSLPPVLLLVLAARITLRRTVEPLKKLTEVADEISTGNLDPTLDFGVHVNCWDIKGCQRTDCRAYMNFSEQCWFLDGTPCEGYEPRFPQKLQGCRSCEVYQTHRGDEIVQLADSFRHMTNVLKESREDLIKSDDFQKRLIRNSFNGIIAADQHGVVTIFNRVAETLTGLSRDDVVGRLPWTVFFEGGLEHEMDKPLSYERVRRVRGFTPRDSVLRREDGSWIDVHLAGISLYERGLHIGRVFFFQDLREIKGLREELIRTERLAATGQAAAGISHSIRNILDGLRGGLYVYRHGQRRGDAAKMDAGLNMLERNVDIISDLVRDLLNFAKDRKPVLLPTDPADLIEEVRSSVTVPEHVSTTVRVDVAEGSGGVMLDRHAMHQCLANLLRNAVEAVPPDRAGAVTVAFREVDGTAVFSVSDDGVGMSAETIDRVQGGLYSTKGSKGTGLGLQVVQKIVKEHGGTLTIESEPGRGSTFRIGIPAVRRHVAAGEP